MSVDKLIKSFEFEFDIPSDTLIVYYSKNEYEEVLTPDKEIEIIKLKHIFQKQFQKIFDIKASDIYIGGR